VLRRETIASSHAMQVDTGHDRLGDTGLLSDLLVGRGDAIYIRRHLLFASEGQDVAAAPLRATAGLLDDAWFSRTRWHVDDKPVAEYCVFDGESIYGVAARSAMSTNGGFFTPAAAGYELFALARSAEKPAAAKKGSSRKRWSQRVPLRATSLLLAGETLLAAGPPDALDADDPWAAYEGRRGGRLLAFRAEDGEPAAEYELDTPPVLDGVIAAGGRLYLSLADGTVLCMESNR